MNIINTKYFIPLKAKVKLLSGVQLCDPMDCSPPGSSVHGIFQARILEWVAISFSRRSSWPRDWTWVSRIVGRRFTIWATREVLYSLIKGNSVFIITFNFWWRNSCLHCTYFCTTKQLKSGGIFYKTLKNLSHLNYRLSLLKVTK